MKREYFKPILAIIGQNMQDVMLSSVFTDDFAPADGENTFY